MHFWGSIPNFISLEVQVANFRIYISMVLSGKNPIIHIQINENLIGLKFRIYSFLVFWIHMLKLPFPWIIWFQLDIFLLSSLLDSFRQISSSWCWKFKDPSITDFSEEDFMFCLHSFSVLQAEQAAGLLSSSMMFTNTTIVNRDWIRTQCSCQRRLWFKRRSDCDAIYFYKVSDADVMRAQSRRRENIRRVADDRSRSCSWRTSGEGTKFMEIWEVGWICSQPRGQARESSIRSVISIFQRVSNTITQGYHFCQVKGRCLPG